MTDIQFIEIDEEEAEEVRSAAGRGRKSTSIVFLRTFMESGLKAAKLARTSIPPDQKVAPLAGALNAFAKKHKLPVLIKARGGEIYFFRVQTPEG